MPRKRKQSRSPVTTAAPAPTDAISRPNVRLRRSSRIVYPKNAADEDRTREIQGRVLGARPRGDRDLGHHDAQEQREAMQEGVKVAIEDLAKMEQDLRRATKRQKQRIEADKSKLPPDQFDPTPFHPRITGDTRPLVPKSEDQDWEPPGKKKKNNTRSGAEVRPTTILEDGGVEFPEAAPEAPERGAARAPPVHSDRLPLPWKGRIGYVSVALQDYRALVV